MTDRADSNTADSNSMRVSTAGTQDYGLSMSPPVWTKCLRRSDYAVFETDTGLTVRDGGDIELRLRA